MADIKILLSDIIGYLKRKGHISVPMLQMEFGLEYAKARRFMEYIIEVGWAENKPAGLNYKVIYKHLEDKVLGKSELKRLYKILTPDCYLLISYLSSHDWGNYSDLLDVVRDEKDTDSAIEILLREKLIRGKKDRYTLIISKKTADKLNSIFALTPRGHMREIEGNSGMEIEKKINKLLGDIDISSDDYFDDDDIIEEMMDDLYTEVDFPTDEEFGDSGAGR